MTEAESYFNELTYDIPDVVPGKMFGALCMKSLNGKSGVMFWNNSLVVKLHGDSFHEAMQLDGSTLFDPSGGRPMKEWVVVPFDYQDRWKSFALEATEAAKALPAKVKKQSS
jgi:hypothetical protein